MLIATSGDDSTLMKCFVCADIKIVRERVDRDEALSNVLARATRNLLLNRFAQPFAMVFRLVFPGRDEIRLARSSKAQSKLYIL